MLKKWEPKGTLPEDDKQLLIEGAMAELDGSEEDSYTVFVADDTLILGVVDKSGRVDIYEAKIVAASQSFEDFTDHAEAAQLSKGVVS